MGSVVDGVQTPAPELPPELLPLEPPELPPEEPPELDPDDPPELEPEELPDPEPEELPELDPDEPPELDPEEPPDPELAPPSSPVLAWLPCCGPCPLPPQPMPMTMLTRATATRPAFRVIMPGRPRNACAAPPPCPPPSEWGRVFRSFPPFRWGEGRDGGLTAPRRRCASDNPRLALTTARCHLCGTIQIVTRVEPAILLAGRYALYDKIAAGGMATVHFGRLLGPSGFARTVAIKRLFPQFAADPEFVAMFLDEARLVSRIRSPYVVPTLDMVHEGDELCIVMEYVPGESLARLARPVSATDPDSAAAITGDVPVPIAVSILANVLEGLHAAHEARSEQGEPLGIVHRDVSPQNVIVGTDGLGHVIDFGVAKAIGRLQTTREGQLKGKLAYMAPEQLRGDPVTRRSDLYAASVVLWETLAGQRLFRADDEAATVTRVLMGEVKLPSQCLRKDRDAGEAQMIARLETVVMRGLDRDPARRFETARDMASALEACVPPAGASTVGVWLERVAGSALALRAARVAEIESSAASETTLPLEMPVQPTQASSISVASSVTTSPPRRRRLAWIALAVLGVLGTSAVVGIEWAGPRVHPSAIAAPSSSLPPLASIDAAPPPPPEDSAASAPSITASAAATPSAATPGPRRPPAAPAANCNPPFTWDAQGKKHYKRNCL